MAILVSRKSEASRISADIDVSDITSHQRHFTYVRLVCTSKFSIPISMSLILPALTYSYDVKMHLCYRHFTTSFPGNTATMRSPLERGPVPISGYLYKMKAKDRLLTPQWNKRFFALEGKLLKYYQHESSQEASQVIDLLNIESIRRFENGDHGVFSFVIKTPERSYFLRAESKGDMKRWVRGLKDQQELWRSKLEKFSDPVVRRPKHYSDFPSTSQSYPASLRS